MFDDIHPLPKYQVTVDLSLGFSVSIYGWFLLDNHPIYLTHKRSSDLPGLFYCCHKFENFSFVLVFPSLIAKFRILLQHLGSCGTQYQRISLDFESSPAMQVMVYERHNSCLVISDTDQRSERQIADAAESKRLQHYCYCGMSCGHRLMIIIITTKELS